MQFGKVRRLAPETLSDLAMLATLHDIGKIAVPEEILKKSEQLTEAEWTEIKAHPLTGCRILQAIHITNPATEEAVLTHHERWNGSGYPYGLRAEAIPLISRLIAIIDAYDVMTHNRPYRPKLTHAAAVEELRRGAGSQFDPLLVTEFVEFINAEVCPEVENYEERQPN